jgi:hypothetical protein
MGSALRAAIFAGIHLLQEGMRRDPNKDDWGNARMESKTLLSPKIVCAKCFEDQECEI